MSVTATSIPQEHAVGPAHSEAPVVIARAVARCRPTVVRCPAGAPEPPVLAELLGMSLGDGVQASSFVTASSGQNVIEAAIDTCSFGPRAYTATDGRNLLSLADALFRASRLKAPIVMTVSSARPSASLPDSNDHSQAMALRDSGWIQLYPCGEQDAVDVHVQAFRIAESLSLPVMVCLDEFARSDSDAPLMVPSQERVDAFLEQPAPLAPALETIRRVAREFRAHSGRGSGGLLASHHTHGATTIGLGVGSVFDAIVPIVDELRQTGIRAGAVALRSFRPFPARELAGLLAHAQRVVVVERAIAPWVGGVIATDVRAAVADLPVQTHTAIAGSGGRDISPDALRLLLCRAARGHLGDMCFVDPRREPAPREPDATAGRLMHAARTHRRTRDLSWQRGSATLL